MTITERGMALRDEAVDIYPHIAGCVNLKKEEFEQLYRLLYLVLNHINVEEKT